MQIKPRRQIANNALLDVHPVLARVLANRGIANSREINYTLKNLLPPQGLNHIDMAAELLADAVIAGASIVVVGDFDADGATSCALAVSCLRAFGMSPDQVSYLVPNRFEFGYGLSPEIVGMAAMRHPDIIVTVDNGISSIDGVHAAQALGITVLVTDHHLPGEELPTADVIVNPNLANDAFKSKNLAGVGVIFYVMLAVRARLRKYQWFTERDLSEPNMSQFLDLVALGTVADVVPLDYNNRILVQQGLQRIRQGSARPGINALLTVGKRDPTRVVAGDMGFAVGPRLNAAGRLDDMSVGIECLLSPTFEKAMTLATQLDELNRERRQVEQSMQDDALVEVQKLALDEQDPPVAMVLSNQSWHQGVVGLVASRIKERLNRPVLALAPGDAENEWKGSCRSVEGVHVRDILARVDAIHPNLITKFGGHAMAAGLSIQDKNLEKFKSAFVETTKQMTQGKDWQQVLWTDGELQAQDFNLDLAEQLGQSNPWGQAFEEPMFEGKFDILDTRVVGEKHLKMMLQPLSLNDSEFVQQPIDAIYFFYFDRHADLPVGAVRLAYQLSVNEFRNKKNLQIMVRHIEHLEVKD